MNQSSFNASKADGRYVGSLLVNFWIKDIAYTEIVFQCLYEKYISDFMLLRKISRESVPGNGNTPLSNIYIRIPTE